MVRYSHYQIISGPSTIKRLTKCTNLIELRSISVNHEILSIIFLIYLVIAITIINDLIGPFWTALLLYTYAVAHGLYMKWGEKSNKNLHICNQFSTHINKNRKHTRTPLREHYPQHVEHVFLQYTYIYLSLKIHKNRRI